MNKSNSSKSNSSKSSSSKSSSSKSNKAYYILIILILIILVIYIVNKKTELFKNIDITLPSEQQTNENENENENENNNKLSNLTSILPSDDIHFISDNNIKSIDVPVFNYKLMCNLGNSNITPIPSNKVSNEKFINNTTSSPQSQSLSNKNKQDTVATHTQDNKKENVKHLDDIKLVLPDNKTLKYLSVFQHKPKPFANYKGIGQTMILTDTPFDTINNAIESVIKRKCLNYLTSSSLKPLGYNLIWTSDLNVDNEIFSIWTPINPSGCASVGDVIVMGTEQPSVDMMACYPITLLEKQELSNGIIWKAINDMGRQCYCWGAGNIDTFRATNIYSNNMNELNNIYNLSTTSLNDNTFRKKIQNTTSQESSILTNSTGSSNGSITI